MVNVQLSFVIFGCAFGAASLRIARSATTDDKGPLTISSPLLKQRSFATGHSRMLLPFALDPFLTVLALFRAMHPVPLPVCLFEIASRFSQRIVFKRLAIGVANAPNRLVVERR
jgi:hypothetical protein